MSVLVTLCNIFKFARFEEPSFYKVSTIKTFRFFFIWFTLLYLGPKVLNPVGISRLVKNGIGGTWWGKVISGSNPKIGYIKCILIACLQVWKLSKEREGASFSLNYHKSFGIYPNATLCKATHQLVNKEQQLWGKHDPSILKIAPKIKYQTYCTPIFTPAIHLGIRANRLVRLWYSDILLPVKYLKA